MKKLILSLTLVAISAQAMALSMSKVREYARFLSDRMAYELNLTNRQYDDCYEVNYDFIDAVGDYLDAMEYGSSYAFDQYYMYLDYRNEDLSYILSSYQYSKFLDIEQFCRPFCIYEGSWAFRPYIVYPDRSYFYMGLPTGFSIYIGGHARRYYSSGFYANRYHHSHIAYTPVRRHANFDRYHRIDFGPVRSGHSGVRSYRSGVRDYDRPAVRREGRPSVRQESRPSVRQGTRSNIRQNERQNSRPEVRSGQQQQRQEVRQNQQQQRQEVRQNQSQQRQEVRQNQNNQQRQNNSSGGGGITRRGRG